MHRFFATPEQIVGNRVVLTGTEVRHARTVLRLRPGDRVEVLDGEGRCYEVKLTGVGKERVEGQVLTERDPGTEPALRIRMGQALLKGRAFETVLRKAVELGATDIVPVLTQRSVARPGARGAGPRRERWRAIAREAAKQCGRARVPSVEAPRSLEDFCRQAQDDEVKLLFWEDERSLLLNGWSPGGPVSSLAFLAGPEGGFSPEEVEQARAYGFVSVSLGPRTLKAETAPLVILSLLQYRWGDLGGGL